MNTPATDYYYDKDAQYQLTAAQIADGWTVEYQHSRVEYLHDGFLENPDVNTPAFKSWHKNGQLELELYYQNKLLHDPNPNTPAWSRWNDDGQLHAIEHCRNGRYQDPDIDTPSNMGWRSNGIIRRKVYYQNGLQQNPNPDTPACNFWDKNGNVIVEKHCCNHVVVPQSFWQWTLKDALDTGNTEQRRVWFETNGGWEAFESEFDLLDEQPDPASNGLALRLCKFPAEFDIYDKEAHIIFCDNASLDLDGSRRRYALVVPTSWGDDALSVMARSFGLSAEEYSLLKVAK